MANYYVQTSSGSGTSSGTLSNPWNGWSAIVWSSLAAGDILNVIGSVSPSDYSGIGSHNGALGNEVIIQGYDSSSRLTPAGAKTFFVNRSHTILRNIFIDGEVIFQASDVDFATKGTNIKLDNCEIISGGITFDFPNGTGANDVFRKYSNITINNTKIHDAKHYVYCLPNENGATQPMQMDGLQITNATAYDLQESLFEMRMTSGTPSNSYFNNLKFENIKSDRVGKGAGGGCTFRLLACNGTTPMSDGIIINNVVSNGDGLIGGTDIGGCAIQGFGKNAKNFGQNKITNLSLTNSVGAYGALNILVCNWLEVDGLYGENISTGTVDGNGLLIDLYNRNIDAKNITLKNILGKPGVINSGCAIMILPSSVNVEISNVNTDTCRHGIYWSTVGTENIFISDSNFNNCTVDGMYGNLSNGINCKAWNNVFTGTAESKAVHNTGSSVTLSHDYNTYNSFGVANTNFTLSSNEKVNSVEVNKLNSFIK